jgi:hypothetical protein
MDEQAMVLEFERLFPCYAAGKCVSEHANQTRELLLMLWKRINMADDLTAEEIVKQAGVIGTLIAEVDMLKEKVAWLEKPAVGGANPVFGIVPAGETPVMSTPSTDAPDVSEDGVFSVGDRVIHLVFGNGVIAGYRTTTTLPVKYLVRFGGCSALMLCDSDTLTLDPSSVARDRNGTELRVGDEARDEDEDIIVTILDVGKGYVAVKTRMLPSELVLYRRKEAANASS